MGVGVSIAVVLCLIAVTIAAASSVARVLAGEQEKQERSQTLNKTVRKENTQEIKSC